MKMKQVTLAALLTATFLAATASAQKPTAEGVIKSNYDRFEDKTSVNLLMALNETSARLLVLTLDGQYSGSRKRPDHLITIVQSLSPNGYAQWGRLCTLNVIADGLRLKFVFTDPPSGDQKSRDGYMYVNTVVTRIDYADFETIARAKKVEMRFEGDEFVLTEVHLAAFRELAGQFLSSDTPR